MSERTVANLRGRPERSHWVRYLEPGRKRRRRPRSATRTLWLVVAVMAAALVVQAILR